MARGFTPQVITANDLVEGDSVFLGAAGWTRDVARAAVATTEEEATRLEAEGQRAERDNRVVGVYRVAVSLDSGVPVPTLRREQIRASGLPTISVGPAARIARAA
jgi:hypothetical protein